MGEEEVIKKVVGYLERLNKKYLKKWTEIHRTAKLLETIMKEVTSLKTQGLACSEKKQFRNSRIAL